MTNEIQGGIPVTFLYTSGIAGEEFFNNLKKGKIVGNKCKCGRTYTPPRTFCEECFEKTGKTFSAGEKGTLFSFTVAQIDAEGNRDGQEIIGIIELKGGKLIHRINADPKDLKIGDSLKAVFQPVSERVGSMNDIKYFEKE